MATQCGVISGLSGTAAWTVNASATANDAPATRDPLLLAGLAVGASHNVDSGRGTARGQQRTLALDVDNSVLDLQRVPAVQEAKTQPDWRGLLRQYPWPVQEVERVMMCESGGDPSAYNPSGSYGLLQIQEFYHRDKLMAAAGSDDPALLFDPAINVAVGWRVYVAAGHTFLPWSCRP